INNLEDISIITSTGTIKLINSTSSNLELSNNLLSYNNDILITNTKESINGSIGSLVLLGGISISCSTDSVNISQGGALTIEGGISIKKKSIFGNTISVNANTLTSNNKITLYGS